MAKVQDPFAMSNVLSMAGMLAIITNVCIVVRYGRRRVLLFCGLITAGIFQLIIAVVYDHNPGAIVTGKVLVALSWFYMMASFSGHDSSIFMDGCRRNPITAPSNLHLRPCCSSRVPWRLADHIHCSVLHQPRCAELGATIRLHLVPLEEIDAMVSKPEVEAEIEAKLLIILYSSTRSCQPESSEVTKCRNLVSERLLES